jgi:hypothetical protein
LLEWRRDVKKQVSAYGATPQAGIGRAFGA